MLFQISILQSAHVMSRQSAHVTSSLSLSSNHHKTEKKPMADRPVLLLVTTFVTITNTKKSFTQVPDAAP